MKVLIIEDEKIAAERLIDVLHQCDNTITILGTITNKYKNKFMIKVGERTGYI